MIRMITLEEAEIDNGMEVWMWHYCGRVEVQRSCLLPSPQNAPPKQIAAREASLKMRGVQWRSLRPGCGRDFSVTLKPYIRTANMHLRSKYLRTEYRGQ